MIKEDCIEFSDSKDPDLFNDDVTAPSITMSLPPVLWWAPPKDRSTGKVLELSDEGGGRREEGGGKRVEGGGWGTEGGGRREEGRG